MRVLQAARSANILRSYLKKVKTRMNSLNYKTEQEIIKEDYWQHHQMRGMKLVLIDLSIRVLRLLNH
jgi:hypothetical protein